VLCRPSRIRYASAAADNGSCSPSRSRSRSGRTGPASRGGAFAGNEATRAVTTNAPVLPPSHRCAVEILLGTLPDSGPMVTPPRAAGRASHAPNTVGPATHHERYWRTSECIRPPLHRAAALHLSYKWIRIP
jgi:hypothetical protein